MRSQILGENGQEEAKGDIESPGLVVMSPEQGIREGRHVGG